MPGSSAYAVPFLPGEQPEQERRFDIEAGYIPARAPEKGQTAPKDEAHLYFMLHRAMHPQQPRRKLVFWLNGGPGCSSFDGALMELGALRIQEDGRLALARPGYAWNEYADVVYVDQPVGTGFSYVANEAYATSLTQVADEFVYFLEQFMQVYPAYTNDTDVYLAGESFAGQYIPYMTDALLRHPTPPVRLSGLLIGNGDLNPAYQSGSQVETLVHAGIWPKHGPSHQHVQPYIDACRAAIAKDTVPRAEYHECNAIDSDIVELTRQKVSGVEHCINVYDMRYTDTVPQCGMNWPPEVGAMHAYLRREDVKAALHVNTHMHPEAWVECRPNVGSVLRHDSFKAPASGTLLPSILQRGVPVLLYAGDQDLVCPALGIQHLVDQMEWLGQRGMGRAKRAAWTVNHAPIGTWQTARNLTLATLVNASHMAPYDAPYAAHDMLLRFMDVRIPLPSPASPSVSSQVDGKDTRILVPMMPHDFAAPPKAASATSADLAGSLVAWVLIGMALALCLYMRRRLGRQRRESPTWSYEAVAQPEQERDVEMDAFTLGDEDDT